MVQLAGRQCRWGATSLLYDIPLLRCHAPGAIAAYSQWAHSWRRLRPRAVQPAASSRSSQLPAPAYSPTNADTLAKPDSSSNSSSSRGRPHEPGWSQIELRPLQRKPAALDAQGLVPSSASVVAVPVPLRPLLDAAVAAYEQLLGTRLVGVYLRGSLAQQGAFVPGVSDADFLGVWEQHAGGEGDAGLPSLAGGAAGEDAAAALREAAQRLQQDFPQCAKVELQLVPLLPGSALSTLCQQALNSDDGGRSGSSPFSPSAVLEQPALAFLLKTQAVCLAGCDLPRLLPDVAALPPLQLLPSLVEDVDRALQHAQHGQQSPSSLAAVDVSTSSSGGSGFSSTWGQESAARAVRWALKRCIRAAFEFYLHSSTSSAAGGSSSNAGKVYSRDLYWCLHYAAQQHPELRQPLTAALQLYLALGSKPSAAAAAVDGSFSSQLGRSGQWQRAQAQHEAEAGGGGSSPPLSLLVAEGTVLAEQLASQLDGLFLQAMLQEEPGWLTHHGGIPPGSSSQGGEGGLKQVGTSSTGVRGHLGREGGSSGDSSSSSSSSSSGGRALSWGEQVCVRLWAAVAGSGMGAGMEAGVVGCAPQPVRMAVAGSILSLDWSQQAAWQQAAAVIAASVAPLGHNQQQQGKQQEGQQQRQPVLLKGAAAHWPAVQHWSLEGLVAAGMEGRVRVAPSLQFPFTEPKLAAILAAQQGVAALPSCVASMSALELAARLQRGNPCRLRPLVYGRSTSGTAGAAGEGNWLGEYYYMQAELPQLLLNDIDLSCPPFSPEAEAEASAGPIKAAAAAGSALRQTQAARVWVSPAGAVSPTHYDLSHSVLVQVRGRKRMLFWSPDQLPLLYFYPDTHLLRRRSRVNVHAPDPSRFPLIARATAQECLLEPGDVVFFPSRWAHYTESLDFSISVTCRYSAAAQA